MKTLKVVRAASSFDDPAFPLKFTLATVTEPHPVHKHEVHELVIILEGVGEHVTGHGTYKVGPGSVIFVEPGMQHGYTSMHGITFANIILEPEHMLTFLPQITTLPGYRALFGPRKRARKSPVHFELPHEALPPIHEVLQRISAELTCGAPGYEAAVQSLLMLLIVLVVRSYQRHRGARSTKTPERIERVLEYIEQHYADPFDVHECAAIAGLSLSQFFTAFKKHKAFSPLQYLIRTRIFHAQELLQDTSRSITDIAFAVGFDDSNYFTRQFRKYTRTTPRNYRIKLKNAL